MKPNILLITTDQQRWDTLGLNQNRIIATPNLDGLAKRGANFTRAYTTCPACIPARRTLLSGLKPETHGMVTMVEKVEWEPKFTLPGLLHDAGYQTQLVGKLHLHPQRKRYGFENMVLAESSNYRPDSVWQNQNDYAEWLRKQQNIYFHPNAHGIHGNGRVARPYHLDENYHLTSWLVDEALDFLCRKRDPSQPWFLHLSFVAPHAPYTPPQTYWDRYINLPLKPRIGSWAPQVSDDEVPAGIDPVSHYGPFTSGDIQRAMAGYYGLISHIDDRIGYFLDYYFQYGSNRSSDPIWIIFTSDHGDLLGDHHLIAKFLPYEGSTHVPFFVSSCNIPLKSISSNALVSLEDVLPTILDLAEVPVPAEVEGKSLAPILRRGAQNVRTELHGEHGGKFANHFIIHEQYKYVWFAKTNEEQIFNLEDDPYEMTDISSNKALLSFLRERMAEQIKNRKDYQYNPDQLTPLENRRPSLFWRH